MLELIIHGDILVVLERRIKRENLLTIALNEIEYRLGAGAVFHDRGFDIGETIVFNKKAHIFVPHERWTGTDSVLSPFLMAISRKPKDHFRIRAIEKLSSIYSRLLKKYETGFAILGEADFASLETAYFKISPVYGENINENNEKYWQKDQVVSDHCVFFGIVLPYLEKRAFYQNPNDFEKTPFFSHTHALIQGKARHLLTSSKLLKGSFWVEGLKSLKA